MKILFKILLISALCVTPISAQSSRGGLAVKVVSPVILANVLDIYVPLAPIPKDPSEYRGKWHSMRLNAYDFTKWNKVNVDESKILRFYEKPDATSKLVGKVKLPSRSGKQLLFFMGNNEAQRYRVFAMNNSDVAWGEYGVFNSTKTSVMFELGKTKKVAKPQSLTAIKPSSEIFRTKVYMKMEGEVKQIKNSNWRLTDRHREFIFCLPRPKSERIRWVHVRDNKVNDVLQKS